MGPATSTLGSARDYFRSPVHIVNVRTMGPQPSELSNGIDVPTIMKNYIDVLSVTNSEIDKLLAGGTPYVCVGIIGHRNTGKSFLMNVLAEAITFDAVSRYSELIKKYDQYSKVPIRFNHKEHNEGIHVTMGIDVRMLPLPEYTILLFDCQGLDGTLADVALACLMTNLCDVLIWNWPADVYKYSGNNEGRVKAGMDTAAIQTVPYLFKSFVRPLSDDFPRIIVALRDAVSGDKGKLDKDLTVVEFPNATDSSNWREFVLQANELLGRVEVAMRERVDTQRPSRLVVVQI